MRKWRKINCLNVSNGSLLTESVADCGNCPPITISSISNVTYLLECSLHYYLCTSIFHIPCFHPAACIHKLKTTGWKRSQWETFQTLYSGNYLRPLPHNETSTITNIWQHTLGNECWHRNGKLTIKLRVKISSEQTFVRTHMLLLKGCSRLHYCCHSR